MVQKIYSKMHLVSCTNTHRDVTDLVNHGMIKNTKPWISWERNIIFLWNKKILNLCSRWHILRSHRFVAEVTFKLNNWKLVSVLKNIKTTTNMLLPKTTYLRLQGNINPFLKINLPASTCSKSTTETLEKEVKHAQI